MDGSLLLDRFRLVSHADPDVVTETLNRSIGGERSCRTASPRDRQYTFNLLRLSVCNILSFSMTPSVVDFRNDPAGAFYVPLVGELRVRTGREDLRVKPGHLLCALPGAERLVEFKGKLRCLGVRINQDVLSAAMKRRGIESDLHWDRLMDIVATRRPAANVFVQHLYDVVKLYDAKSTIPDRRTDKMFGNSVAQAAADMLAFILPDGSIRTDGPSYAIAAATERFISENYSRPLSLDDIAEALDRTVQDVESSVLLHVGLSPRELLTLVRLVAAETYVRRPSNDPGAVARVCGFVNDARYQVALNQRERLRRKVAKGWALGFVD